uniref:Uncharacterized protein n=1 Tax=Alsidium seaforthii TaxID=2007182 RepID=A0A1Z1MD63_9FLOR|nr:hypothetical protein [Bryothamnion seaforthii]ARW63906.1 hypothetical protein [Bryothamnion seaforthii]
MDNSYSLIRIYKDKVIEFRCYCFCESIKSKYSYPICFTTRFNNLESIFYTLSLCTFFNLLSTKHKLYVGKELCKAEISIKLNQKYIQN